MSGNHFTPKNPEVEIRPSKLRRLPKFAVDAKGLWEKKMRAPRNGHYMPLDNSRYNDYYAGGSLWEAL